jgi:MFS family permease
MTGSEAELAASGQRKAFSVTHAALTVLLYALSLLVYLYALDEALPTPVEVLFGLVLFTAVDRYRRSSRTANEWDLQRFVTFLAGSGFFAVIALIVPGETVKTVAAVVAYIAIGEAIGALRSWSGAAVVGVLVGLIAFAFLVAGLLTNVVWVVGAILLTPACLTLIVDPLFRQAPIQRLGATRLQARLVSLIIRFNEWTRRGKVWVLGVVVFAAGVVVLWIAFGWKLLYAAVLGIVVFFLVIFVVSRTNTDVVLVGVVIVFAWALEPRTVSDSIPGLPTFGDTVVAIGDSYQSGEGAPTFIEGTNQRGFRDRLDNQCRRAPTAYPALIALGVDGSVPRRLAFFSCSGAVADNLLRVNQYEGEGAPTVTSTTDGKGKPGEFVRGVPQLDLARRANLDVSLVLISIGGNDVGFGNIVEHCLGPTDCSTEETKHVFNSLVNAYALRLGLDPITMNPGPSLNAPVFSAIAAAFPSARRVLVPYPVPVADKSCKWSPMTNGEHATIGALTRRLNAVNTAAAKQQDPKIVVAATEDALVNKYVDRRICGDGRLNAAVNLFALNPQVNPLSQVAIPSNWFHNSVHPTPLGHRLLANSITGGVSPPENKAAQIGDGKSDACATLNECSERLKDLGASDHRQFFAVLMTGLAIVALSALLCRKPILNSARNLALAIRLATHSAKD